MQLVRCASILGVSLADGVVGRTPAPLTRVLRLAAQQDGRPHAAQGAGGRLPGRLYLHPFLGARAHQGQLCTGFLPPYEQEDGACRAVILSPLPPPTLAPLPSFSAYENGKQGLSCSRPSLSPVLVKGVNLVLQCAEQTW